MGKSGRIERVYFEVKDSRLKQWHETQILQSRRSFLHSVEMGSQKNKLKGFMSFCDETIFEVCTGLLCTALPPSISPFPPYPSLLTCLPPSSLSPSLSPSLPSLFPPSLDLPPSHPLLLLPKSLTPSLPPITSFSLAPSPSLTTSLASLPSLSIPYYLPPSPLSLPR